MDGSRLVYVYRIGEDYKPGKQHQDLYSPCLCSTRAVGVRVGLYSIENVDGTVDVDSVEKRLEAEERRALPIINRIRNGQIPDFDQRLILASYVMHLWKRLPVTRAQFAPTYDRIKRANFEANRVQLKELEHDLQNMPGKFERIRVLRAGVEESERLHTEFDEQLRNMVMNKTILETSDDLLGFIATSSWTFYHARNKSIFLSSDNPVYFNRTRGISRAPLTIAFSSSVALEVRPGPAGANSRIATEETVSRINRNTVCMADEFVVASVDASWISKFSNRNRTPVA